MSRRFVFVTEASPLATMIKGEERRREEDEVQMGSEGKISESQGFLGLKPYYPPKWAQHLKPIPSHMVTLAHVPTPIHKWNLPGVPATTQVYIKRDDLSGMQLSGNKARKLEFVLADAVLSGADCVITMGAIQSNHTRTTAVAAKYLNLDCFLILITTESVDDDPGLSGNLLIERLAGAEIELTSWENYRKYGSPALLNLLKEKLVKKGRRPYVIPVGASSPLGAWGYIEAVREIEQQQMESGELAFDDIITTCGSGGTVVGLSLGSQLSTLKAKVHGFSVGDKLDNIYAFAQAQFETLGSNLKSRDLLDMQDVKGLGYSVYTAEELLFIKEVAETTGVILDPCYSGKAAYGLCKDLKENPTKWKGRKVLFIHTGGVFALYDKAMKQLSTMVGPCQRMDIDALLLA